MSSLKILAVFHELNTIGLFEPGSTVALDRELYETARWAGKPNSTQRLNLVNLKALMALRSKLSIDFRGDTQWRSSLAEIYMQYDVVVINPVPSERSIQFCRELLNWDRENGFGKTKLIFGTEVSWDAILKREQIDSHHFESLYSDHLMLRHTARNDRPFYDDDRCFDLRVQEFPLGLDLGVMPTAEPITQRNRITVVRAPEGRRTKNNAGVEELIELIALRPELSGFEVYEVNPPYTITEYWDVLSKSSFLLFTSIGETFSYALNDAKALGVVTLLPERMYYSSIGWKYVADTYPEVGIRYRTPDEAVDIVCKLAGDTEQLSWASEASYDAVSSRFSLDAITENWARLLTGQSLNNESIFIYGEGYTSWNQVVSAAKSFSCRIVMPYRNRGVLGPGRLLWADYDVDSDIIRVLDYLTSNPNGDTRTLTVSDDFFGPSLNGTPAKSVPAEVSRYLQLLARTYGLRRAVVDNSLMATELPSCLDSVRFVSGVFDPVQPIRVESTGHSSAG